MYCVTEYFCVVTGVPYWNTEYMSQCNLTPETPVVKQIVQDEIREAQRRLQTYRQGRPALQLKGKTAIIVDDGVATGATIKVCTIRVNSISNLDTHTVHTQLTHTVMVFV